MAAYFHLTKANGTNVRIKLKSIADIRPMPPSIISVEKPVGTTIQLKNGQEIDIAMSIAELRQHIKW